jgi:transposase
MPKEQSSGKPTARRYSPEEKAGAVRMVRTLRAELGTEYGTVGRVARQLGYGIESMRSWVRQVDIDDGYVPGVSTAESRRIKELEQENRELKRANDILKRAARPQPSHSRIARSQSPKPLYSANAFTIGRVGIQHLARLVGRPHRRDQLFGIGPRQTNADLSLGRASRQAATSSSASSRDNVPGHSTRLR